MFGAHLPGQLDARDESRILHPFAGHVGLARAAGTDLDGLAHEATGRGARHNAVFSQVVMQAALDFFGELLEELFVPVVEGGFEETAFLAGGDFVVDGVDDEAATAEIRAVVLGVVQIAGEAGPAPDDQPGFRGIILEVGKHFIELGAVDGARARAGDIGEDTGEDDVVLETPGAGDVFLLIDGQVLLVTTGIAKVSADVGPGREGEVI